MSEPQDSQVGALKQYIYQLQLVRPALLTSGHTDEEAAVLAEHRKAVKDGDPIFHYRRLEYTDPVGVQLTIEYEQLLYKARSESGDIRVVNYAIPL